MKVYLNKLIERAKALRDRHPAHAAFVTKLGEDNVGLLAGFVSWSILTSIIPIVAGVVALSGLLLRSPSVEQSVIQELSHALQGVLSTEDIQSMVHAASTSSGLLAVIGFVGIFWGSSNVGGA